MPVSLWRNRSYLLLAGGQAISEIGTQVSDLAYILLILVLTDALSYLASVLSLLWIKVPFQQQRQSASRGLWGDIKEGFLWLKSQPLLRFMTLMIGGLNMNRLFITPGKSGGA